MTAVRKLTILLCGYEIIRKSGCVRGASRAVILAVPICAYLIETDRGYVLYDTGLDADALADPEAARRTFVNDTFPAPPIVLPEHDLMGQLATLGVAPGDVTDVILSHSHSDHTGALKRLPGARVWIQRLEHEAAFSEAGRTASNLADVAGPVDWRIVDGDWELAPGIEVLLTRGHRPGHQSAVVTLPSGAKKILVGDVVDLIENFDREVLGSSMDDAAAMASLLRLKRLAAAPGVELVPLHDPGFVQTARLAPEFYD
jgi:N-acyl homoserine lactone hydrolase